MSSTELWALIAGAPPATRRTLGALLPELDVAIAEVFEACLDRDPARRPDAASLVRTLRRMVNPLASTLVGGQAAPS